MRGACKAVRIATKDHPWHYTSSGLDHVYLVGIEVATDPESGEEEPLIPRARDLHDCLFLALANKPGALTGSEVRYMRRHLHWTQAQAARKLRVRHAQYFSYLERKADAPALTPQVDLLWRLLCLTAFQSTGRRKKETLRAIEHLVGQMDKALGTTEERKESIPVELEQRKRDWRMLGAA